jgi:hypothetical protein
MSQLLKIGLIVALAARVAPALAGFTSPTLLLSTATATSAGGGHAVAFTGSFDFPNTVQPGYPLHLVVSQGTRFVRYPILGPAVAGTSTVLADGLLVDTELPALLAAGAPAPATVRVLTVTATDLRVILPPGFGSGPTRAVLFTILPDGPVVSNPIDFVVP